MRPTDPRLRSRLQVARGPLTVVVAANLVAGIAVIVQAFAVAALVVAVVGGHDLLGPAVAVAVAFAVRVAAQSTGDVAAGRAATRVSADLRRRILDAIVAGGTGDRTEGELATLATRGVTAAEPFVTRYLPAVALAAVLPALTVVTIATQDLLAALIVVLTLPLLPVFGALVGHATRDRAEAQWRSLASLSGHFVDVVRGLPTLVAYRRARAQSGTIRAITHRYRRATVRTLRIAFASSAVLDLVATLSVALVAVVVGVRLAAGGLGLETGLVVLLLAPEAYWPLRRMGAEFHAAAEGVATFEAVDALGTGPAAPHHAAAVPRLCARNASYTYPGRRVPAVAGLDLAVPDRGLTVLVGPSGCGKSTALRLLAGLLVPDSGPVCGTVTTDSTRVGWLPQRPSFRAGTVAENLRLGAPDATDEQLLAALDRVALGERIALLGGLGADVGEDARLLSAGERVRLALARTVLADRPWIMLDEPTAHLDPVTRKVILDVLVEESRQRAVVAVTHEPETIAVADQVVRLPARPVPAAVATPVPPPPVRAAPAPVATDPDDRKPARFWLSTLLGTLSSLAGIALTATAGWLIVKASEQPPMLTMLVAIVAVRTFGLARPVLRYVERIRSHDAALRLLARRRVEVYDAVVPLTPGRLGKRRGDVLASVVDDVDATLDRELRIRLPLRTYLATTVVAVVLTALLLPAAGLVLAASSAVGTALGYLVARVRCAGAERAAVSTRAELSASVLETAQLAEELRIWQAGDGGAVDRLGSRLSAATRRVAGATTAGRALVNASVGAGVLGAAAVAASAVGDGRLSGPLAALVVLVPLALGEVATGVVEAGALEGRVRSAEQRLAAYAATAPAVTDPAAPEPQPVGSAVDGRDLSLGWERPVSTDVSLRIGPGERVAVVGPSGSGKSTLAATLVRFIDPVGGTVTLGGTGLDALALDDVRSRVGLVDDDPHVFATTLVENVRLARHGASDDDVLRALRAAHLGPWVAQLPEGLDTWLGDGHAQVSGGERARLGLARSLLADQPVLVLDEPLAHLDRGTAEEVAHDLLDGAGARSVVWITHSDIGLDQMDRTVDLGR
ncbi:thiol reductant ABC exporter subunit CydD [Marmoricola sp. RAF53]|uniref:thiol reductant ABC exporter subunit CydD n=1 Tax=Marmoricola sp. RAF53 TaxID=3233059 RepID=UPI003F9797A8